MVSSLASPTFPQRPGGQNDQHLPFVQFSNAASRERHHDHRNTGFYCARGFVLHKLEEKAPAFLARLMEFGWALLTKAPPKCTFNLIDIPLNVIAINDVLELPEVSNTEFEANLQEMDLDWLRNILIELSKRDQEQEKRRRTGKVSNNKAAVDSNDEDPQEGARAEEDLEAIRKRMVSAYANFTPVPLTTTLEVEIFRRQLRQEKRKGLERDRLMAQMWKTIKAIFSCVAPEKGDSPTRSKGIHVVSYVE
uniref:Uncharacterized protein n=1 Tax=Solanum tuberosum TaxID=4113 RepID=M1DRX3_SOLTU